MVSMLTSSWNAGYLGYAIRMGHLSRYLARPGSTLFSAIANNLSEKLVKLVPLIPMVAALWWAFRGSVELPADAVRWLLFAVSVIAAGVMVFSIDIMIASLAFWLDDVWGVTRAYQLLSMILRGQLVPLALMPAWAEGFIDAQPFRFTLSFPLELVVEDLATREMAIGMALQIGYAVLAVLAARWQWRRGLRAYSAVGA
jgi:ABC-2 type transport system permease protein